MSNAQGSFVSKVAENALIYTRQLNNVIENTGTKKFGLGVLGGGLGEFAVESRTYFENNKEISTPNIINSTNNVLKSGLAGGVTANANVLQAWGLNTVFGVALKNQTIEESLKESSISSGISTSLGFRTNISEPISGATNSILTDEIKRGLDSYDKNKESK